MRSTALAAVDERKCRVIELRYFGGLSVDETARALELSVGDDRPGATTGRGVAAP